MGAFPPRRTDRKREGIGGIGQKFGLVQVQYLTHRGGNLSLVGSTATGYGGFNLAGRV